MEDPVLIAEIATTGPALLPVSRQGPCLNVGLWQLDLDGIAELVAACDDAVREIRKAAAGA